MLDSIYYYTGLLRIIEMMRRHPVPPPHHYHQYDHHQQQPQQPLDLIAGVQSERQQQLGGSGTAVTDDGQLESQSGRWRWFSRHWHGIVCVIFAVSLLADATVVSVVWWQWTSRNCSTTQQPHCPDDHAARVSAAQQKQDQKASLPLGNVSALLLNTDDAGRISAERIANRTSQIAHFSSGFEYRAADGNFTVRHNGIYLIYSRVSFRSQDKKTVFKHDIREVKGNSRDQQRVLLHNVVEKQCRSSDVTCHSSLLVSSLWLKAGYEIYVTAEPMSLLNASSVQFGVAFVSH